MLRLDPDARWPLLLAAVRDEMIGRRWDWPAEHWPETAPGLIGGRDQLAGGTWLAVRGSRTDASARPAVAAVLNGSYRNRLDRAEPGAPPSSTRPSRGRLPLLALRSGVPDVAELRAYEVVHLVIADADGARLLSWDGREATETEIAPGDHIVTNEGLDVDADPLVPHFAPLLAAARAPGAETAPGESVPGQVAAGSDVAGRVAAGPAVAGSVAAGPTAAEQAAAESAAARSAVAGESGPGQVAAGEPTAESDVAGPVAAGEPVARAGVSTARWWGDWADLMRGDGLAPDDPRALLVRHEVDGGLVFGSSSATLLALGREPGEVRLDFTSTPRSPEWTPLHA